MKQIILIFIVLIPGCFTYAQAPFEIEKIIEIKILESSRDDVRRIMSGYKFESDTYRGTPDVFYTSDAEIKVEYSAAECIDEEEEIVDWKVPQWRATEISITPKAQIQLNDLKPLLTSFGTSFSKLKKEKMFKNIVDQYIYHNKNLGIEIEVDKNGVSEIRFGPPKKDYSKMCNQRIANILLNTKSLFYVPLKKRIVIIDYNDPANINNLILSFSEITKDCPVSDSTQNKNCSNGIKAITIFAVGIDPQGDVLAYNYKISGGKIIGQGAKVIWDLSDVKAGTYTITATADDGSGLYGQSITKTVVVKECPDCH